MKDISQDLKKFNEIDESKLKNPITFFGSARLKESSKYYKMAKDLAFRCVESGFTVVSGGGGGIMRAANEGAFCAKKSDKQNVSVGFNIYLPLEQRLNDFVDYNMLFDTLAIRKMALIDKSVAFVVFPGGFGTLDEFCEILTLKQLGFKKVPIFVVGSDFWYKFKDFIDDSLLSLEVISKGDEKLFEISDDLEEIINKLKGIV